MSCFHIHTLSIIKIIIGMTFLLMFFLVAPFLISCSIDDPDGLYVLQEEPLTGIIITSRVVESDILERDMHYAIYLPHDYEGSNVYYPVLYLLHGRQGSYLDWINNGMSSRVDAGINAGEFKEMVVVMPDGLDSFYCNNLEEGGLLYEDFFIQEFIPDIERSFRVIPNRSGRSIAGLGMGGYGAAFHAFKRPGIFGSSYAISGTFPGGTGIPDLKELINEQILNGNDDFVPFTMECGTEDLVVYASNVDFHGFLNENSIGHHFIERPGAHDWEFWIESLPATLKFASDNFN